MKRIHHIVILTFLFSLFGCSELSTECTNIQNQNLAVIVDVSDQALTKQIIQEIHSEAFLPFLDQNGYSNVNACNQFSISFCPIGGKDELQIETASLAIGGKNLSNNAMQHMRKQGIQEIKELVKQQYDRFLGLSESQDYNSGTFILNTFIKNANFLGNESENEIIIFSDGVENSTVNFYKGVPSIETADVKDLIDELVDPIELRMYQENDISSSIARVVLVLKEEPNQKVSKRELKEFYVAIFKELDIDLVLVDRLSSLN